MSRGGRLVSGVAGSAAVHGLLILALVFGAARIPRPPPKDKVVELTVVDTPKPKPPPPPAPKPPPPKPPPPKPRRRPPARLHTRPPPRPVHRRATPPPPPPSNAPPPKVAPKKPVPLITGISMGSTVASSDMTVGVGNTVYGTPDRVAHAPSEARPYQGSDRYVPPTEVATLPEVAHEVKAAYPPKARRAGIEGKVRLRLRIDARGKVVSVKVLSGLGHGLDAAAVRALKAFRFKPATLDGQAVGTEIDYVYTFVLD